jgi:catalase
MADDLAVGTFTPSQSGASLTRAPHLHRQSTPVTVRFSDGGGIPTVPDNDPNASPRGMAIRFHLAEHVHTDIVTHSVDGFPVRTAEELVELLRAVSASGPGAPQPTPIEKFIGAHPAALQFVQAPKPIPVSFATESFFAVNAYKFSNAEGVIRFGRYRIRPDGGGAYLDDAAVGAQSANFLMDEIKERVAKGPVQFRVTVPNRRPGRRRRGFHRPLARRPASNRIRQPRANRCGPEPRSRATPDHFRSNSTRRWDRSIGRPPHRTARHGLLAEWPPTPIG